MAKRRINGDGCIRKRSDGRWEGIYVIGNDEKGKPIRKNILAKTQAECSARLKKAIEESQVIDITVSDKMTVNEWMGLWMENYCKHSMRQTTYANYTTQIKHHIKPHIGNIQIRKLTTLDLQKLYNKLLKSGRVQRKEAKNQPKGLSPKTVKDVHIVIYSACERAVSERLIAFNPANGCKLPKSERKEMKTLDLDNLNTFFDKAKERSLFELYYTELSTGLRRGELLGLHWSDIDFNTGALKIQRQLQRINGEIVESPLKTKNAYRKITLPKSTLEILKNLKKSRESDGLILNEYVFCSIDGKPLVPDSMRKTLGRILKSAGLESVRFHDLRHTFATLALQNGVDIKTLSGILGHYSTSFTLDTYGHVSEEMMSTAAEKVDNFLESVS